jgi:hypothetical protein
VIRSVSRVTFGERLVFVVAEGQTFVIPRERFLFCGHAEDADVLK